MNWASIERFPSLFWWNSRVDCFRSFVQLMWNWFNFDIQTRQNKVFLQCVNKLLDSSESSFLKGLMILLLDYLALFVPKQYPHLHTKALIHFVMWWYHHHEWGIPGDGLAFDERNVNSFKLRICQWVNQIKSPPLCSPWIISFCDLVFNVNHE